METSRSRTGDGDRDDADAAAAAGTGNENRTNEQIAEDFQNAWAREMQKANDKTAHPPNQDMTEDGPAERHAANWFGPMCDAVKDAAKQTPLPSKPTATVINTTTSITKNQRPVR